MKHKPQIRQQLAARLAELDERRARIHRDRTRAAQALAADFAEQAVETENDEVLDALDASTGAEAEQLRHALHRFDDGVYGLCERCGAPIEASRLRALPQATECLGCAAHVRPGS